MKELVPAFAGGASGAGRPLALVPPAVQSRKLQCPHPPLM